MIDNENIYRGDQGDLVQPVLARRVWPLPPVMWSPSYRPMANRILLTIGLAVLLASRAAAQSVCRGPDADLDLRVRVTKSFVMRTDAGAVSARQQQGLPAVSDTSVQAILTDSVCAAARDSYNAALPTAQQQPGRLVYVIRVGNRYVVVDPTLKFGEFELEMVLDRSYAVLSKSAQ